MSVELEELFHDLDQTAPTMSVSADSVVASGQRKVRRRRALWGAGTGALAAAAAVAIAVGTALPDSSSTSPMPAHSSTPPLGQFFQRDGDDAGLPRDEVTSTPMGKADGKPATPSTTYQVYRKDGVLRIRRIDKTGSLDLPEVAQYKDGGSATNDRDQTVIVRPVPPDTVSAQIATDPDGADFGMMTSASAVLSDGTTAAVFITAQRIDPITRIGYASWWTTGGALQTSNGETAVSTSLVAPGMSIDVKLWTLRNPNRCGLLATFDRGSASGDDPFQSDGTCATNLSAGTAPDGKTWDDVRAVVTTGPVTDVVATATPGHDAPSVHQTRMRDGRVVLWTVEHFTDNRPSTIKSLSWTDGSGRSHTSPSSY